MRRKTWSMDSAGTECSRVLRSRSRSTSSTSTYGTTMAAQASTAPSWAVPTSCNGMATIRCCRRRWSSTRWPMNSGEPMAGPTDRWLRATDLWVEAFAVLNLGFLTLDIYLAHSLNGFRKPAEYIPLLFSAIAPVILIAALALQSRQPVVWKILGFLVGGTAILVGFTGVILHLESRFFLERTLRSLT